MSVPLAQDSPAVLSHPSKRRSAQRSDRTRRPPDDLNTRRRNSLRDRYRRRSRFAIVESAMFAGRPYRLPVNLAIVMIGLLAILTVGWVLLSLLGAFADERSATVYWVLLPVGATFLALLLAGVVGYLVLTIKAINLSRRQSNFIDSVTHELKSPLASMKLYLQTLSRHQVPPEQQNEFFQIMLDDLERLDRLINQMLAAGRIDSARIDGEAERIDLAELLAHCARSVCAAYRLPAETVTLRCEPCTVLARAIELDLIFRNLIDNAVKYAGVPPWVQIELSRGAARTVRVRISDNGRGIPRKLRRQVFGRFVRLGSELEREKPGTGLGLYIVRTLVQRLGGRVNIADRGAQPGTVFTVVLPIVAPPAETGGAAKQNNATAASSGETSNLGLCDDPR